MREKCALCRGIGTVFMHRPTAGPSGLERCGGCGGTGYVFSLGGSLTITFAVEVIGHTYPLPLWVTAATTVG